MFIKKIITISVVVLLIFGCKQEDKIPDTYIDRFYNNQKKLNSLTEALETDSFLANKWGQVIESSQFNDTIKQKLNELKIIKVYLFSWGDKQRHFDFITAWRQTNPIHLYYNTVDSIQTVKGFYKKDEYSNETWGLGDHWSISLVRKYIETLR